MWALGSTFSYFSTGRIIKEVAVISMAGHGNTSGVAVAATSLPTLDPAADSLQGQQDSPCQHKNQQHITKRDPTPLQQSHKQICTCKVNTKKPMYSFFPKNKIRWLTWLAPTCTFQIVILLYHLGWNNITYWFVWYLVGVLSIFWPISKLWTLTKKKKKNNEHMRCKTVSF